MKSESQPIWQTSENELLIVIHKILPCNTECWCQI